MYKETVSRNKGSKRNIKMLIFCATRSTVCTYGVCYTNFIGLLDFSYKYFDMAKFKKMNRDYKL